MSDVTEKLPKGAKGISGEDKTVSWKLPVNKPIKSEVYWRCACGGGAPLNIWKCELCGKDPR